MSSRRLAIAALAAAAVSGAMVSSPAAASPPPPPPPPPVVTAAGSGSYGGITGLVDTPNGGLVISLYTSKSASCPHLTSGPGVTQIPGGFASDVVDGQLRFFIKPPSNLTAGTWIWAQAYDGATYSGLGPCTKVETAEPMDAYVSATTPTTATLSWRAMPGATGYTVRVMRRSAYLLRTIDVGNVLSTTITDLTTASLYRFHVEANTVDGPGDAAWTPSNTPLPFTTIDMLTDQQFHDFEGRAATQADIDAWFADLYDGKPSVPGKIEEISRTRHWSGFQSPVIRLFKATFGRWPDKGGLDYWSTRRRQGTSLRMVATVMTQSSEFQRRYGSLSNRDFVKRIYLNVLGRSADSSGLAYWTGRLDRRTVTRGELVLQFSESSEHVAKTDAAVRTTNVITGMLRRMPTASELSTWAGASPPPTVDLIKQILGFEAYLDRIRG